MADEEKSSMAVVELSPADEETNLTVPKDDAPVPNKKQEFEVEFTRGLDKNTKEGRNLICIMFIGVASQLDNSIASLSIQPYYELLQNESIGSNQAAQLYGLANGIYWLAQFCFAPLFGMIIDKVHSYKTVFIIGMTLQAIGNALYALLFVIQRNTGGGGSNIGWQMLILSRTIQGMGSAVVVSGTTYITSNTKLEDRTSVLGGYRTAQLLAASIGGALAYVFVPIPEPTQNSPVVLQVFNFYTMGGWIAVLLCSYVLWKCLASFEELPHEDLDEKPIFEYVRECAERMKQSVWLFVITCCTIQFIFFFSMLSIQTQVFNLSFAAYKVVDGQKGIWKPWVAVAIGALPASILWKYLSPHFGAKPEKVWTNIGILCGLITAVFLLPYYGPVTVGPQACMYIGLALIGTAQIWFGVNQEVVYSKQVSYMTHTATNNRDGFFISLYMMTNALANFCGPFVVGFVWITEQVPGSNDPCSVDASSYNNSGCQLSNYGAWIGVLFVALGICLAVNTKFDSVLVTYPATDAEAESKLLDNADGDDHMAIEEGGEVSSEPASPNDAESTSLVDQKALNQNDEWANEKNVSEKISS